MSQRIAEAFNLQGWVLYRVSVDRSRIELFVGRPRKGARCTRCSAFSDRVHARSPRWRSVLHTRCGDRPVYLKIRPRRFRCRRCGSVFTEPLPGIGRWARHTNRAARELLGELAERSFRSAARAGGTSSGVLRRLLHRHVPLQADVEQILGQFETVALGIDEHSFRGKDMMTTVTCLLPQRRPVAILRDDRLQTVQEFVRNLPEPLKERTVAVCIDLKSAWRNLIARELPHARIVADPFHVIQDANRRVDEARRLDQQVSKRTIPRWPLVKNEDDLTERQAEQLAAIRKEHKNVAHFHWVKEQLCDMYAMPNRQAAAAILDRVIFNAEQGSDVALVQWSRMLRLWREPILAWHDLKISNGYTEGLHTKIKLIKRMSYGLRNPETYVRKMLLALVPITWLTSLPHLLT